MYPDHDDLDNIYTQEQEGITMSEALQEILREYIEDGGDPEIHRQAAAQIAAFDALLADGFSITIRKVKGGTFRAECLGHDYESNEHRAYYGRGKTWAEAVSDAAWQWATVGAG
jgi:hypothetical protein